jgi:hypothetical protein
MATLGYVIKNGPKIATRAYLNDLPFYRRVPENHDGVSAPAAHWLVPGENTLALEVLGQDTSVGYSSLVEATVRRMEEDEILARVGWPEMWKGVPEEEQKFPARAEVTFHLDDDLPKPLWADSPSEHVPREGTSELVAAVYALHEAIERRDPARIVDLMSVKIEDLTRYHGRTGLLDPREVELDFAERFKEPVNVEPFDAARLRFDARQRGRVVHVTRDDGRRVVAFANRDESKGFFLDPFFVRHGGTWRLFR